MKCSLKHLNHTHTLHIHKVEKISAERILIFFSFLFFFFCAIIIFSEENGCVCGCVCVCVQGVNYRSEFSNLLSDFFLSGRIKICKKKIQNFSRKKVIFIIIMKKSLLSVCKSIYLSFRSFHVLVCVCVYLIKDIVHSFFFSSLRLSANNRNFSILVKALVATGVKWWCKQQKAAAKIDRKRWKQHKKVKEKKKLQTDENDNARTDLKFCNLKIIHPHTYAGVMHFTRIWYFNMKSWEQSSVLSENIVHFLRLFPARRLFPSSLQIANLYPSISMRTP